MSLEHNPRRTNQLDLELSAGRSKEIDTEFPVLSGLEEILGDPSFDQIKDLSDRYKKIFSATKIINDETGKEQIVTYYRSPLVFIVVGPIGTGKTTTSHEMNDFFSRNGFDVLTATYEEALVYVHPDTEKDMDVSLFPRVNLTLFKKVKDSLHEYPNPTVLLIEAPLISEINPRKERQKKQRSKTNRDRAATAVSRVARYMDNNPIYIMAMSSDLDKQKEMVTEREEILELPREDIVDYLIQRGIIQKSIAQSWEVDVDALRKELKSMGMPRHFDTMREELNNHKRKLNERINDEYIDKILEIRERTLKREQSEEDREIVLNQLTLREFIIDLGVKPKRIIDAYNPSRDENHPGYYKSHIHPKEE